MMGSHEKKRAKERAKERRELLKNLRGEPKNE